MKKMVSVYLNGKFIGEHDNPKDLISNIKEMRRKGLMPKSTNVKLSEEEEAVSIFTDKGRARRPVLTVKDGKPTITKEHLDKLKKNEMTWDDLVSEGIVEYLDAEEEENSFIAIDESVITPEHTHVEISPTVIMGPQANMVPYGEHSMSFRVTLGAKMVKQSLGMYATNTPMRADTDVSIIHYPQVPVVKTQMYDLVKFEAHPAGQNVVVAIMPYEGYNLSLIHI